MTLIFVSEYLPYKRFELKKKLNNIKQGARPIFAMDDCEELIAG
jgi:hypothetical protein